MNYKGGLTKGKSHAEGGIKMEVASTGQQIEVEGGEVIVNKKNVADETLLEFEGEKKTTCEILSDLNSRNNNGVTLDCDSVEGKKYKYSEGGKLTDDDIYIIEHSHNGTIKEIDDQFKTAKFNTIKDAREFVKDLIRYEKVYGYDFENGSYFQIQKVIEEGEEYENVGRKINYKEHKYFKKGGSVETWKDKYNKKYGYPKNKSHSLEEISKDTGVSMKGLKQIYEKGEGAYYTNPSSVRPNVKSPQQWAMARVYSSVMGGKASKVDAKELKMEKGGILNNPNFKSWFGDSKVVDENGNPLVVYHGTGGNFDKFKDSIDGGSWFTSNPIVAEDFVFMGNPSIMPVYLSLKNPYIVDLKGSFLQDSKEIVETIKEVNEVQSDKYDGVILKNALDYVDNPIVSDIYVSFEPTQIKSAIGNSGDFDPNNPSIIMQKGGKVNKLQKEGGNNILEIPKYQRTKRVPAILKNIKLEPLNEDFGKLTTPIIGDDELRPVMSGNFFDIENKAIVGTDAHKLYKINMDSTAEKFDGIYKTVQTIKKEKKALEKSVGEDVSLEWFKKKFEKIEGRFPNYKQVVPTTFEYEQKGVDLQKMWWFSTVISKARILMESYSDDPAFDVETYNSKKIEELKEYYNYFIDGTTYASHYIFKENGVWKQVCWNAKMIEQITRFMLSRGMNKVSVGIPNRASESQGASVFYFGEYFHIDSSEFMLLMSVLSDYQAVLPFQDDLSKNPLIQENVVYNLQDNTLMSGGKKVEINEEIGFVPKGASRKSVSSKPRKSKEELSQVDVSRASKSPFESYSLNEFEGLKVLSKNLKGKDKNDLELFLDSIKDKVVYRDFKELNNTVYINSNGYFMPLKPKGLFVYDGIPFYYGKGLFGDNQVWEKYTGSPIRSSNVDFDELKDQVKNLIDRVNKDGDAKDQINGMDLTPQFDSNSLIAKDKIKQEIEWELKDGNFEKVFSKVRHKENKNSRQALSEILGINILSYTQNQINDLFAKKYNFDYYKIQEEKEKKEEKERIEKENAYWQGIKDDFPLIDFSGDDNKTIARVQDQLLKGNLYRRLEKEESPVKRIYVSKWTKRGEIRKTPKTEYWIGTEDKGYIVVPKLIYDRFKAEEV